MQTPVASVSISHWTKGFLVTMVSAARVKASTARLKGAAVEERKRKVAEVSQVKSLMERMS